MLHELQQDWSFQLLRSQQIAVQGVQVPGMHVIVVAAVEVVEAVVEGEVEVAMVQMVLK